MWTILLAGAEEEEEEAGLGRVEKRWEEEEDMDFGWGREEKSEVEWGSSVCCW